MLTATLRSSTPKEWRNGCVFVCLFVWLQLRFHALQYVPRHEFYFTLRFSCFVEVSFYLILGRHELDVPLPVNWATAAYSAWCPSPRARPRDRPGSGLLMSPPVDQGPLLHSVPPYTLGVSLHGSWCKAPLINLPKLVCMYVCMRLCVCARVCVPQTYSACRETGHHKNKPVRLLAEVSVMHGGKRERGSCRGKKEYEK